MHRIISLMHLAKLQARHKRRRLKWRHGRQAWQPNHTQTSAARDPRQRPERKVGGWLPPISGRGTSARNP